MAFGTDEALPLRCLLMAAHARVVGALAGVEETITGFSIRSGRGHQLMPCRLHLAVPSFRHLAHAAHGAERALQRQLPAGDPAVAHFCDTACAIHLHGEVPKAGESQAPGGVVLFASFRRVQACPETIGVHLSTDTGVFSVAEASVVRDCYQQVLEGMAVDPDANPAAMWLTSDDADLALAG